MVCRGDAVPRDATCRGEYPVYPGTQHTFWDTCQCCCTAPGANSMCMIGKPLRVLQVPRTRPLTGYREWSHLNYGRYKSIFRDYLWKDQAVNKARPPGLQGLAGFWAFNNRTTRNRKDLGGRYRGKIAGWGTTVIHEYGFRCQYAKIIGTPRSTLAYSLPWKGIIV